MPRSTQAPSSPAGGAGPWGISIEDPCFDLGKHPLSHWSSKRGSWAQPDSTFWWNCLAVSKEERRLVVHCVVSLFGSVNVWGDEGKRQCFSLSIEAWPLKGVHVFYTKLYWKEVEGNQQRTNNCQRIRKLWSKSSPCGHSSSAWSDSLVPRLES